ncbi:hypothetical protein Ait01nite_058750 [Actinoplanes italicus]|uniref:PknH-like protein n=1 Tax=Actinoplanes italicus TaxID=113567 RepID=A0A2T0K644_9ACTN|nr:hypothetical protein [Actinoplanes italicus]PRX18420.1 hypothetical protein CLV67_113257 [Actinoplanes italicus]GIE32830.1 hypothetical protein Ait01nite_058750 [Actinoplanes italicus]
MSKTLAIHGVAAALIAVLSAVPATVAAAGPPEPERLRAALLAEPKMPHGYRMEPIPLSPEETQIYGYWDECAYDRGEPSPEAATVSAFPLGITKGDAYIKVWIGAPGPYFAREEARKLADWPTKCPKFTNDMAEVDHRISRLPMPAVGDASAAIIDHWSVLTHEGTLGEGRDLRAAVAVGGIAMTFETSPTEDDDKIATDAEFVTIVVAATQRLAAIK